MAHTRMDLVPLTEAERAESLRAALAAAPRREPIDVFGYGSLIWSPCFVPEREVPAVLPGHERRFCIWSVHSRGTPERPGLGLGLEAGGGECQGILQRVPGARRAEALAALWSREMYAGVYRPAWVEVITDAGPCPALAFVVEPRHAQYAGALDPQEQASIIAGSRGVRGTGEEYLRRTVAGLRAAGLADPRLFDLLDRVAALGDAG